jgi:hypothetical protein
VQPAIKPASMAKQSKNVVIRFKAITLFVKILCFTVYHSFVKKTRSYAQFPEIPPKSSQKAITENPPSQQQRRVLWILILTIGLV